VSEPEVVVIGGGPAGLSAAVAAAEAGATVALFDEGRLPGGELRYRRSPVRPGPDEPPERPDALADRLVAWAAEANVVVSAGAVVWSLFGDGSLGVSIDGASRLVRPGTVVVATGSTDLPLPFPGGSLPGVFSGRAVLIAINAWGVLPGRRWALVGGGPERDDIAEAIALAGGAVVIRADPAAGDAIAAAGPGGIERAVVNGQPTAVDCIAVTVGRQPDAALAIMAGCALGSNSSGGPLLPVVDAVGRSSVPRIFVVGDAAGICSPEVAMAEGRLAGLAAALELGRASESALDRALAREGPLLAERIAARQHRAAAYLQPYRWERLRMADRSEGAPCFVCRCEEVAEEDVRRAIASGASMMDDVKRRTKAGMGLCQGIFCTSAIAAMIDGVRAGSEQERAPMTARPPVRPVPLDELAELVPDER